MKRVCWLNSLQITQTSSICKLERHTDASILLDWTNSRMNWDLVDVLLGGKASKRIAAEVLGVVDTVHSFPTTVFWETDGAPVVHTVFNGPAGKGYEEERAFLRPSLTDSAVVRKVVDPVDHRAFVHVGHMPRSVEDQFSNFRSFGKHDFV